MLCYDMGQRGSGATAQNQNVPSQMVHMLLVFWSFGAPGSQRDSERRYKFFTGDRRWDRAHHSGVFYPVCYLTHPYVTH